jgi:hypothetical protein
MKKSALFLILWIITATTLMAGTRIIPVAGHLPGANGSSWTTDVSITNNDSAPAAVELLFHQESGLAHSRTVIVPAGLSILLPDAVRPDSFQGTNPASWIGQLEIRSTSNIGASASTSTTAAAGGTYGSAYESFDPSVLSSSGAVSGLVESSRYRSNIAYANAGESASSVSYTLRREDGSSIATRQLSVPAHATLQIPLARDTASSSDDARLMLEWSATSPLYVIASVIDNRSNDPTNIPSANSSSELFFPVVGKTAGAQTTFWSTSAAIGSRADVAGSTTLAYRDTASGQLFTKTVSLAPRGTLAIDDVNDFVGAGMGSGSLTISSTVRVVAALRLFNSLADGSTYGSALLPQDSAVRSSLVRIDGVRRDASYRLNVSLASHSEAADGTVRLFDDNGQQVESEPFHAEHDSMTQISLSRGETEVHSGHVEVETHNGASVTAVASSIDNHTGDTSVHESEQENERQHELEIQLSASTTTVGSAVSFTLANASGVAGVQWTFGDGSSGSGLTVSHAYASAGEFNVTAQVTLTSGAVIRDAEDVHVLSAGNGAGTVTSNGPIDFTWSPLAPIAGQQVTFTASRTSSGGSFKWRFPNDVRVNGGVATFTFSSSGTFEVELELEHEGTSTLHATHGVTVGGSSTGGSNPTPTPTPTPTPAASIEFSWAPAAPLAGQAVTFTASGGNGGAFVFKFPGNVRLTGSSVTFTFATAGSYEVELEQEKEGSTTLHAAHSVTVGGAAGNGGGSTGGGTGSTPPASSVNFSWSPASPRAGQPVTFSATSDRTPSSGSTFKWRFPNDSRPTGTTATYTFATAGTYRVRVQLEQPGQSSIEQEKDIVIAP